MIPKECKRLAEVDFPIAVVSRHAVREKSIRHGHPSTLHLWWARRPLAACRAMLLGLLLPDPCDEHCPADFKREARGLLPRVQGSPGRKDLELRRALLKFIGDFANWDLAAHRDYLEVARGLVRAAHGEEPPLVVDPFAGGGSIPLEALRLGCDAFASDLNPVACLILKVMLEDIPRHGPELAEELRRVGKEIKEAAEKELADLYPPDPDGARPIAYLWARTVRCEAPKCGAEIPLVRSFWLSKKANRRRALRYRVVRPKGRKPRVEFEIFEPANDAEVPGGTVTRAKATCPCCNTVLAPERVRNQLHDQCGGTEVLFDEQGKRTGGPCLLAVVRLKEGDPVRQYRVGSPRDYRAVSKAMQRLELISAKYSPNGLNPVPDEPLPPVGTLGFRVQRYGMLYWGDLFTARQKVTTFTLRLFADQLLKNNMTELKEIVSLAISRRTDISNALCRWASSTTQALNLFGRQALPMSWDFAETSPLGGQAGDPIVTLKTIIRSVEAMPPGINPAGVQLADATNSPLHDEAAAVWFTDPPYYDAIPYADLSDFFLVWLKRALLQKSIVSDPFDSDNSLSPKVREIVQDETKRVRGHPKNREFFEEAMARAFAEGYRVLEPSGVGSVVFAHKTTEGWEALLSGMIHGGWTITGSWPIATEREVRLRSRDSAALATSVHLVCRPRPEKADVGDWSKVLRQLPKRVGDWMERLQEEGVRGADLVFACIGPALEIFSRYSRVETAEGREIDLAEFLEKVWEVVGRTALGQILGAAEAKARNSAAGAVEEDARLTALFLWTIQATDPDASAGAAPLDAEEEGPRAKTKGPTLIFDVVRRFAQPLGIHLPEWEGRVIETSKGVVRLLPVRERAKQLFGKHGAQLVAEELERQPATSAQLSLFPESERPARGGKRGRGPKAGIDLPDEALATRREATTLDRVHAAMLLQADGRANALRNLIKAEQERGPEFLRLANALSALYPRQSEEKRLLDAMLLAVPR